MCLVALTACQLLRMGLVRVVDTRSRDYSYYYLLVELIKEIADPFGHMNSVRFAPNLSFESRFQHTW